ncbi:Glycogen synthase [compost metagenome]
MKLIYVASVNPKVQSGYYNAVLDRIFQLRLCNDINLTAINYSPSPSSLFDIDICKPRFLFQKGPIGSIENIYIYTKLYGLFKKTAPDVVHVHWCYPIGYCTVKVCKALNIPCVMTCHGSDIHTNPLRKNSIKKKSSWALKNASLVIFVSKALKAQAINSLEGTSSSIVIPNGLNTKQLPSIKISKITPKGHVRKISFVGNLNKTKGADLLPLIFREILERNPEGSFIFTIAGDGPLKNYIDKTLKEYKVNATLLGHIPRGEALNLIAGSDLMIIPSRHEGFGIVALESFALNTPCIGFNILGLQDIFEGNENLLVESFSIESIAIKAISVLEGHENVQFSRYIPEYGIPSTVKREIETYTRLLRNVTF